MVMGGCQVSSDDVPASIGKCEFIIFLSDEDAEYGKKWLKEHPQCRIMLEGPIDINKDEECQS